MSCCCFCCWRVSCLTRCSWYGMYILLVLRPVGFVISHCWLNGPVTCANGDVVLPSGEVCIIPAGEEEDGWCPPFSPTKESNRTPPPFTAPPTPMVVPTAPFPGYIPLHLEMTSCTPLCPYPFVLKICCGKADCWTFVVADIPAATAAAGTAFFVLPRGISLAVMVVVVVVVAIDGVIPLLAVRPSAVLVLPYPVIGLKVLFMLLLLLFMLLFRLLFTGDDPFDFGRE